MSRKRIGRKMRMLSVEPTKSLAMRKYIFVKNKNHHWKFQVNQLSALNTQGQWFHGSKHDDYFGDNQVKRQNQKTERITVMSNKTTYKFIQQLILIHQVDSIEEIKRHTKVRVPPLEAQSSNSSSRRAISAASSSSSSRTKYSFLSTGLNI